MFGSGFYQVNDFLESSSWPIRSLDLVALLELEDFAKVGDRGGGGVKVLEDSAGGAAGESKEGSLVFSSLGSQDPFD